MTPIVSIIMGSTSDLPVMEKGCQISGRDTGSFRNACCRHTITPAEVEAFAKMPKDVALKVIIALQAWAAHLCGVIASMTLPVIVPINASLDGMDALLAIVQMPRVFLLQPLESTDL